MKIFAKNASIVDFVLELSRVVFVFSTIARLFPAEKFKICRTRRLSFFYSTNE